MNLQALVVSCGIAVCFWSSALAQNTGGSVHGSVIDIEGHPVMGARVTADPLDGKIRATAIRFVESDQHGHFEIDNLAWGVYKLFAIKESDGYPNTMLAFYSANQFPTVTLSPTTARASISLRLGPKAGSLIMSAIDAESGKPLNATLTMRRLKDPALWMSTAVSTATSVLVPGDTDISLEVVAPDHEKWYSPNSLNTQPLRIKSGEEHRISVKLSRIPDSAKN